MVVASCKKEGLAVWYRSLWKKLDKENKSSNIPNVTSDLKNFATEKENQVNVIFKNIILSKPY